MVGLTLSLLRVFSTLFSVTLNLTSANSLHWDSSFTCKTVSYSRVPVKCMHGHCDVAIACQISQCLFSSEAQEPLHALKGHAVPGHQSTQLCVLQDETITHLHQGARFQLLQILQAKLYKTMTQNYMKKDYNKLTLKFLLHFLVLYWHSYNYKDNQL